LPRSAQFVVSDRAVVVAAASTALGAWRGGGPGVVAGVVVVAAATRSRRPWLLCLALGVVAAGLADRAMAGLDPVAVGPIAGWGTLLTDPEGLDGGGVRALVRVDGERLDAVAFGAAGGALAERLAGEEIVVRGTARPLARPSAWTVSRRIVGRLDVEGVGEARAGPVGAAANGIRRTFDEGARDLPLATRTLLTGIVLGDDREQPAEVVDDFRASGLAHLLAVSGSNVAFLLVVARPALTRLRWSARAVATIALLTGFALVVRLEPSVLRAVAMAGVATLAAALGRPAAGLRILGLAVIGLLLVDPLLVRSLGFGLSVGASAAILALAPRIEASVPGPAWWRGPASVTLAAHIGTLPLVLPTFGEVPVAALPANLAAAPAAGGLMVWGLTAGLAAGVLPGPAAAVLHLPTSLLAWWLLAVARSAAGLPLGSLRAGHVAFVGAVLVAARGVARLGVRAPGAGRAVALVGVGAVLVAAAVGRPLPSQGAQPVGPGLSLWAAGASTAVVVDGAGDAVRRLESMRRHGARCVDVVVVAGGGRSAAVLVEALRRRCPGPVVLAPAGRAHPGWTPLEPGSTVAVGDLVVAVTSDGAIGVGDGSGRFRRDVRPSRHPARPRWAGGRPPPPPGRGGGCRRRRRTAARRRRRAGGATGRGGDRRHPGRPPPVTPPVHLVRGSDPSLVRDAVRHLVDELVGDADRALVVDEHGGDGYDVGALADAAQTPPFLTDRRVVVGRELHQFKADDLAPLVAYLADPLPTTSLVLVWEAGAVPKSLGEAVKRCGGVRVDTDPGTKAAEARSWLAERVAESGLHLDRAAVDALGSTLGQDVGRVRGVLDTLVGVYGEGARLGADDIGPYLGEAGEVAPWALTDAIDRGDIPGAIEVLHRIHPSSHALVVMASLHGHVQRMLALDGSGARGEKEAAEVIGAKGSTYPARKALEQGRRLGSDKVAQAVGLLAQADIDLRGGRNGPDQLLLEVLVARLANLSRR
jgi:DNA polymerase-3 subunit delta